MHHIIWYYCWFLYIHLRRVVNRRGTESGFWALDRSRPWRWSRRVLARAVRLCEASSLFGCEAVIHPPDDDWCQEKEGRKKVGIFMHMCSPCCDDLFSLGHSVWVACGAELWPRKVCVCAGSSLALRSCTACPCSYVFTHRICTSMFRFDEQLHCSTSITMAWARKSYAFWSSPQAHALFMAPRTKMQRCHKDDLWQNNEKSYGDFRH